MAGNRLSFQEMAISEIDRDNKKLQAEMWKQLQHTTYRRDFNKQSISSNKPCIRPKAMGRREAFCYGVTNYYAQPKSKTSLKAPTSK
ncbi:hypothetical protein GE061_015512 [Apolygus lucorum]|uniref:Uncharacterized protein n=1 Tax=Apolygus lucorum TaxID=248454 RepID=A0A6A4JS78_APOLU|nr:hypothetical protein GE061_015512 [Apolygus lucorum]